MVQEDTSLRSQIVQINKLHLFVLHTSHQAIYNGYIKVVITLWNIEHCALPIALDSINKTHYIRDHGRLPYSLLLLVNEDCHVIQSKT